MEKQRVDFVLIAKIILRNVSRGAAHANPEKLPRTLETEYVFVGDVISGEDHGIRSLFVAQPLERQTLVRRSGRKNVENALPAEHPAIFAQAHDCFADLPGRR